MCSARSKIPIACKVDQIFHFQKNAATNGRFIVKIDIGTFIE